MNTTKWSYILVHYVPSSSESGDIEWVQQWESRDIDLPSEVEDPASYLQTLACNEQVDMLEFELFTCAEEE